MNSKIVKIFSVLALVSFLVVGSLAFYVHKKLEPESLKKEVTKVVSNNYPNLKLELSNLTVKLGVTTEIVVSGINLQAKLKKPSTLLSLNKALVKIPIINILTGGGVIKVELIDPLVNFEESEEGSNWERGLKKTTAKKKEDGKAVALPVFLSGSQINAELKNLSINHFSKGLEKNHFLFETIQLKDIGIKRPMAFKLSSSIALKSSKFKLSSIGELNLRSLIEDKVLMANTLTRIKEITLEDKKLPIEEIVTDAKILFRKDKTGKIDLEIKSDELLNSRMSVFILKDEIKVDIEKTLIKIETFMNSFDLKMNELTYNDSFLNVKGIVTSSPMDKIIPDLDLSITKPLAYRVAGEVLDIERLNVSLKDKELQLDTSIKVLKGRINFSAANNLDVNKPIDFSKLETTKASLVINGLEIPREMLASSDEKEAKKGEKKQPLLIPLRLSLELKNIMLENEVINGSGEIVAAKNKVAVKALTIKHGDGSIVLDSTSKNLLKNPKHSFHIEAKKINAQLFDIFLSKDSPRLTGLINATSVGKVSKEGTVYDMFIKGNARNGELKNYDLSSLVNSQVSKINSFPYFKKKPIREVKIPQDYERINFDINAKTNKTTIKKITFVGVDKKIEVKAQGVFRAKGKSEVFVNLFDKKQNYLKFLKKNFDTTSLPMKMIGKGYELKPDYDYTSSILLGRLKNVAKRKLKKKVKAKAKKELKKMLKGKKAKDLIKGLFQ